MLFIKIVKSYLLSILFYSDAKQDSIHYKFFGNENQSDLFFIRKMFPGRRVDYPQTLLFLKMTICWLELCPRNSRHCNIFPGEIWGTWQKLFFLKIMSFELFSKIKIPLILEFLSKSFKSFPINTRYCNIFHHVKSI